MAGAAEQGSSAVRGYLRMWRQNLAILIVLLIIGGIVVAWFYFTAHSKHNRPNAHGAIFAVAAA